MNACIVKAKRNRLLWLWVDFCAWFITRSREHLPLLSCLLPAATSSLIQGPHYSRGKLILLDSAVDTTPRASLGKMNVDREGVRHRHRARGAHTHQEIHIKIAGARRRCFPTAYENWVISSGESNRDLLFICITDLYINLTYFLNSNAGGKLRDNNFQIKSESFFLYNGGELNKYIFSNYFFSFQPYPVQFFGTVC